jgi:nucleoside-diphosphate-sugar epimerase
MTDKILITGASGQIGSELTLALAKIYGNNKIIASDISLPRAENSNFSNIIFEELNVLDVAKITQIIKKHNVTIIYHLAAILSATGEGNPQNCWNININGLINILEISRQLKIKQIIHPSSIAVFGSDTPKINTLQNSITNPSTIYGISKLAGEMLCSYYVKKYSLDIRGLRYPGLISHKTPPGGGTTDYAVDIFYQAILNNYYCCFLQPNTILPMMYMDDAIRGTIELANANWNNLKNYANFNFAGVSFSCQELADEIKKYLPNFKIEYNPDYRQEIANSWPQSIDDSQAKEQWGWKANFDLPKIVQEMIKNLSQKLK